MGVVRGRGALDKGMTPLSGRMEGDAASFHHTTYNCKLTNYFWIFHFIFSDHG